MKRFCFLLVCCACSCLGIMNVMASPIDLSSFTAGNGVALSGGVVTFTENEQDGVYYFEDNNFLVNVGATDLSFDFSLTHGTFDYDDYLVFELNYGQTVLADITSSGHAVIDLSSFAGTQISLAWGLIWGGDEFSGTTATVYNINLASNAAPVPEPSTLLLFGSGIITLYGIGRNRLRLTF